MYITEIINGLGLLSKFQLKIQKYDKYTVTSIKLKPKCSKKKIKLFSRSNLKLFSLVKNKNEYFG